MDLAKVMRVLKYTDFQNPSRTKSSTTASGPWLWTARRGEATGVKAGGENKLLTKIQNAANAKAILALAGVQALVCLWRPLQMRNGPLGRAFLARKPQIPTFCKGSH